MSHRPWCNPRLRVVVALGLLMPLGWWRGGTAQSIPGGNVAQTSHNLVEHNGDDATILDTCGYCHGSHGVVRLARTRGTASAMGPYAMYSGRLSMPMDAQPGTSSLACLACHDGTLGLEAPGGTRQSGGVFRGCVACHGGGTALGPNPPIGTDLSTQHPIAVLYDPSLDPDFRSVAEVQAAGLVLIDGKIQCATCHDPHYQTWGSFLRISAASGELCQACHVTPRAGQVVHSR